MCECHYEAKKIARITIDMLANCALLQNARNKVGAKEVTFGVALGSSLQLLVPLLHAQTNGVQHAVPMSVFSVSCS